MYSWKFHGNVDTNESHENWYIEVLGYAEHESGLNFLLFQYQSLFHPYLNNGNNQYLTLLSDAGLMRQKNIEVTIINPHNILD